MSLTSLAIFKSAKQPILIISLCLLFSCSVLRGLVQADTSSVTQTYQASSSVLPGMLVEPKTGQPGQIIPLSENDIRSLLGVVVPTNQGALVLSQSGSGGEALVASNGLHPVLVSDQNGSVVAGDYLVMSPIAGITMKADPTDPYVVGRAESNFDGVHGVLTSSGPTNIGGLTAQIGLTANPLYHNYKFLPSFVSKTADGLANKQVSLGQMLLSLVVVVATIVMATVILASGVRGGMVSIGRNPLSRLQINKGLIRVTLLGFIVLAIGLALGYVLLIV